MPVGEAVAADMEAACLSSESEDLAERLMRAPAWCMDQRSVCNHPSPHLG